MNRSKFGLPPAVAEAARLRNDVVAWTHLDPAESDKLGQYLCCQTFGLFLILPCFWPHLLIMWPCLCSAKVAAENRIRNTYWILTDREVKIVVLDHDVCCVSGCSKSGNQIQTIPLENITDAGIDSAAKGCINNCAGDQAIVYIDTASSGSGETKKHEAQAIGLEDYDWFIQEILNCRDKLIRGGPNNNIGSGYNHLSLGGTPGGGVASESMNRTEDDVYVDSNNNKKKNTTANSTNSMPSIEDRLQKIETLREKGLLSNDEYETARKQILSTL